MNSGYLHFPEFDPVIFSLGPVSLHWYGLMYLVGFVFAMWLATRRANRPGSGWTKNEVENLLYAGFLGVFLGGRIGYVLFYNLPVFLADPLYLFRVWDGGMSFHGGLIGVILVMIIFARRTKRTFFQVSDFIAPFPTDYQLDQIGKLVLVDRTRPWMLNKYFDAAHFRVVDKPMDQQTLFAELCQQLLEEGFVDAEFHASVVEREAIVSTMLGDGIALPHSLGLLAKKTVVYTVIAPQGIAWGDETAHLIFLLAISKREYEEAMAIYDIFVTFLRERAMSRLAATRSFDEFKTVAMECVSRF